MWRTFSLKNVVPVSKQLRKLRQGQARFTLLAPDQGEEYIQPLNTHERSTAVTVQKLQQLLAPDGEYGLTPKLIEVAIMKCPDLLTLRPIDLQVRLRSLQLHLNTKELHQLLNNSPQTLLVHHIKLQKQIEKILDETGLHRSQMKSLLIYAGQYFNNYVQSKKKLDYLHLHIGETKYEVDALLALANVSLEHMTLRHEFLVRRGQHFAPDRHGNTKIVNPTVMDMILSSQEFFCNNVAHCPEKEYELFCKMYNHEQDLLKWELEKPEFEDEDDVYSDFAEHLITHLKEKSDLVKFDKELPTT